MVYNQRRLWPESNHFRLPEMKCKAAFHGKNELIKEQHLVSFVHELKCICRCIYVKFRNI